MDFKKEKLMMSEEEVKERTKELLNENQADLITKYMFLEQQVQKQKEVIDKLKKKIKVVKQYDFDKVGRYELLDILKEVSE